VLSRSFVVAEESDSSRSDSDALYSDALTLTRVYAVVFAGTVTFAFTGTIVFTFYVSAVAFPYAVNVVLETPVT
jgi:hypothetical protein